ncbi:MAG: hypothetical protein JXA69_07855, partial [Phycisphaerae bacterium]|nr:hypothetical protein [Phycisphaerae bacterium]
MKLEVLDDTARPGHDMTKPAMVMDPLQLGRKKGSVGLQAYAGMEACFSNFTYRVHETGTAISAAKSRIPPRNVIAQCGCRLRTRSRALTRSQTFRLGEWPKPKTG